MRRFTKYSAAAAVALVALTVPAVVSADPPTPEQIRDLEVIELDCEVHGADERVAAHCRWTKPVSPDAAAVKLFRLDPDVDPHRQVVYRSENVSISWFTDSNVLPGHRYAYGLVVYDEQGRRIGQSRPDWVRIPPVVDVEVLKLACALGDGGEAIGCEWSSPESRDAWVVTLWRSVNDGPREVVERFRPSGPTVYRDRVPAGASEVTYVVIATSESDRIVARSRPETVRIPPVVDVEALKLACALGDGGEAIGCEWSSPESRDAWVVTLWRSVNDGPREVVERFRPSGPTVYRDRVPAGASEVTYVVIATSESDRIVARSRPETVRIPPVVDVRPVDTRPVDTRPVDTRPVDTRPVDTRPVDTRPVDTRPVDTRPVDTRPVDTRPVDTRPVDTRPVDTRPVDTRPVDTRPVDTRPVDTRPVDTRPVDTRPVDTRPVDTRPVDTRPVDTRPVDTVSTDLRKERPAP